MFLVMMAEAAVPATVITNPGWMRKPSGEDFARLYPDSAASRNLSGRATISCVVKADGNLRDCKIDQESPPNEGFGNAALRMAAKFQLSADVAPGTTLEGGTVKIPIRFKVPGGFNPLSPEFLAASACYAQSSKLADHHPSTKAWRATLYWYTEMAKLIAGGGGTPSELEMSASEAHAGAEAEALQIPKGSELDSCLAKAAKK